MESKYQLTNSSIYLPGTSIPKNKLNISDPAEIHELERTLLEDAYQIFYNELDEQTVFDEKYYISLHKRTFDSLYEWAGIYRSFNMAKGNSRFCQGSFVEGSSKTIFKNLEKDNFLRDYSSKDSILFAEKIAYYQGEIIALHPFFELNGRITRLFFDMIATYNEYEFIDYSVATPEEYIQASIDCVQLANSEKLKKIIENGLKR